MLILRQMSARRMEDEISYLHRQLSMQVSSFGNKKQPSYIQLSCVIQGKPSGKKQRTGHIKNHTDDIMF